MLAQVIVVTLEVHYKEFRATLSNQIRACTAIRRLRISLSRRRMLPPFKMRRRRCKQTPESRTRGQEQEQEDARRCETFLVRSPAIIWISVLSGEEAVECGNAMIYLL